jgi:hypothetical protein
MFSTRIDAKVSSAMGSLRAEDTSEIFGSAEAQPLTVFRGVSSLLMFTSTAYPTIIDDNVATQAKRYRSYQLTAPTVVMGGLTTTERFSTTTGVGLAIRLNLQQSTAILIVRNVRQTVIQFLSAIAGAISGALLLLEIVVGFVESRREPSEKVSEADQVERKPPSVVLQFGQPQWRLQVADMVSHGMPLAAAETLIQGQNSTSGWTKNLPRSDLPCADAGSAQLTELH